MGIKQTSVLWPSKVPAIRVSNGTHFTEFHAGPVFQMESAYYFSQNVEMYGSTYNIDRLSFMA